MRICVIGAGAIGGLMAAKFALADEDVTIIDQGAHLDAIRNACVRLRPSMRDFIMPNEAR